MTSILNSASNELQKKNLRKSFIQTTAALSRNRLSLVCRHVVNPSRHAAAFLHRSCAVILRQRAGVRDLSQQRKSAYRYVVGCAHVPFTPGKPSTTPRVLREYSASTPRVVRIGIRRSVPLEIVSSSNAWI